jgi:hypothetical protein
MHREVDLNRQFAEQARDHALKAISELSALLVAGESGLPKPEFQAPKQAVASIIGLIERDVLASIYAKHRDLDDLGTG